VLRYIVDFPAAPRGRRSGLVGPKKPSASPIDATSKKSAKKLNFAKERDTNSSSDCKPTIEHLTCKKFIKKVAEVGTGCLGGKRKT